MNKPEKKYQNIIQELEQQMENKKNQHTVYLSRRAIWVNIVLCLLISYVGGYIHTRRWKALGVFTFIFSGFLFITQPSNQSFTENFAHGQKYAFLAGIISTIDNSIAIKKA
ncbi:hypothetical protein [Geminocystis sp. GBBB08]|uniref:hypothetical protein n=1 Tax=Geminocystis sp. GBBB08 TaxID=2604140 RepID=UPI0027E2F612|nr:hypothetical protein [Geminocystis sp. GBBB08]MBL1211541.1 solute carrier organic anion transporter [Geminocystis sp. GBBB08]